MSDFFDKNIAQRLKKDSKLTLSFVSSFCHFFIIFPKTVLHKSTGFQFHEIIFCIHEGHCLKIQKNRGTGKRQ